MSIPYAEPAKRQWIYAAASIAGLILLLVWMQGGFVGKMPPGTTETVPGQADSLVTARAEVKEIDEIMAWPATVSARTVAQLAPKVGARLVEISVKAGDTVKAGQVLAKLDQGEWQARLRQARSALAAAEAEAARAQADARRTQNLFDQEAATRQTLDAAIAAARAGTAQAAEARAAVSEAESHFGETTLRAPFDGAVAQRLLEPGDMAMPGTPVLVVQSERRLRVEADVPEQCAAAIQTGTALQARVGEHRYTAVAEEIAPAADPRSRTVLVKASLNGAADLQPGAFAWLEQACGRRSALLIPAAAVSRSGQLESVRLLEGKQTLLRHVRAGKSRDGWVEVLSGLKEGELVVMDGKQSF